jgi:uncharacterized cupin superfamily protein
MKTKFLIALALSVVLFSCSKEETPEPEVVTPVVTPTPTGSGTTSANSIVVNDTITHASLKGSRVATSTYSVYKCDAGDNGWNVLQLTSESSTITSGTYNVVDWGKSVTGLSPNDIVVTYQITTPLALYRSVAGGTITVTVEGNSVFYKFNNLNFTNDYGSNGVISADVEMNK